jgi:hypothetical protein
VDEKPVVETKMIGICRIETSDWVNAGQVESNPMLFNKYIYFYEPKYRKKGEFMVGNKNMKGLFSIKEKEMIKAHAVLLEQERERAKLSIVDSVVPSGKEEVKKGGKAPAKKDLGKGKKKPAAAAAKDQVAVEIADLDIETENEFLLLEKNYMISLRKYKDDKDSEKLRDKKMKEKEMQTPSILSPKSQELEGIEKKKADKKEAFLKRLTACFEFALPTQVKVGVKLKINDIEPPPPPQEAVQKEELKTDPKKKGPPPKKPPPQKAKK